MGSRGRRRQRGGACTRARDLEPKAGTAAVEEALAADVYAPRRLMGPCLPAYIAALDPRASPGVHRTVVLENRRPMRAHKSAAVSVAREPGLKGPLEARDHRDGLARAAKLGQIGPGCKNAWDLPYDSCNLAAPLGTELLVHSLKVLGSLMCKTGMPTPRTHQELEFMDIGKGLHSARLPICTGSTIVQAIQRVLQVFSLSAFLPFPSPVLYPGDIGGKGKELGEMGKSK